LARLSQYILRETLAAALGVSLVLMVVLLTNQLAQVLKRAADNGFAPEVLGELVALGGLRQAEIILPIGFMLGVMLALGRLYHDSEMTAATACGVGPARISRPILMVATVVATLVAMLSLWMSPWAAERVRQVRSLALQAGDYAVITPGRFRGFGDSGVIVYAEAKEADGSLRNVFVKRARGERYEIALADRARHEISADGSLHTLTLYSGERYEGVPGTAEFRRIRFAENRIPVRVPEVVPRGLELEARSTASLLGDRSPLAQAELQRRLSLPLSVWLLAWLAIPLSKLRPRQGRYARLWQGIVIYFLYMSVLSAAQVWVEREVVSTLIGLWWVHGLLIAAIIALQPWSVRQSRWRAWVGARARV
jgi:lipopolysaccharide export system permease protein